MFVLCIVYIDCVWGLHIYLPFVMMWENYTVRTLAVRFISMLCTRFRCECPGCRVCLVCAWYVCIEWRCVGVWTRVRVWNKLYAGHAGQLARSCCNLTCMCKPARTYTNQHTPTHILLDTKPHSSLTSLPSSYWLLISFLDNRNSKYFFLFSLRVLYTVYYY